jgi:hypothetical protein
MKLILAFIAALPEILRLIDALIKDIERAQTDRKVKEDLAAIEKAFREKDADSIRKLFNS